MTGPIIFLVILAAIAVFAISVYNGLIAARNETDNAFAQIDVQLTRRYDLIPNLVNIAKKYLQHERETLEAVIEARNQAQKALSNAKNDSNENNINALSQAETQLSRQMGGFYALFESYPELKANTQMMQLTEEVSSTENKVAFARQHFNDVVTHYNNRIEQFPGNIFAGMLHFVRKGLLEIDNIEVKREAITIDFD